MRSGVGADCLSMISARVPGQTCCIYSESYLARGPRERNERGLFGCGKAANIHVDRD